MTWFTERRLDFIDWRMAAHGSIRRADLIAMFEISVPQASTDLQEFMRLYPGAIVYDASARQYVPARRTYKPRRGAPTGVSWK